MDVEAVVLTGGAGSRMGRDKAEIMAGDIPLTTMICRSLSDLGIHVTVLGRKPVDGFAFKQDEVEFEGPLAAISRFPPSSPYVFVAACDLILWDVRIVSLLRSKIEHHDAAVPTVSRMAQPLCALYTAAAIARAANLVESGERRTVAWLSFLDVLHVSEKEIASAGLEPYCVLGANTPEELAAMLRRRT